MLHYYGEILEHPEKGLYFKKNLEKVAIAPLTVAIAPYILTVAPYILVVTPWLLHNYFDITLDIAPLNLDIS